MITKNTSFLNKLKQNRKPITIIVAAFLLVFTIIIIATYIGLIDETKINNKARFQGLENIFLRYANLFYFTNLTNLFSLITLLILAIKPNNKIKRLFLHSTVLITITFLIYWSLISWQSNWKNVFESYKSLHTHLINPLVCFIFAFLWKDQLLFNKKDKYYVVIYVMIYLIFALILYLTTYYLKYNQKNAVVIYGFLDFINPFFYHGKQLGLQIVLNILFIVVGFTLPFLICLFWTKVLKLKANVTKTSY
ncbi:MAGa3780 family membrane protein [Mycoplasma zalophi]|uniref:DUF1600 domain-containing protein n=1 Tax=Mycoplasma zalophi TaxID=191287 RepID=A0ABS6DQH9_9MOLU|nr:hypothetical protein [Mycoplasma zalophi]MBU4690725.1 hypothetical protein [Mycoplasma zalophi]MBU4692459.1 hypothetical protein [Mycoplasma zalophi]